MKKRGTGGFLTAAACAAVMIAFAVAFAPAWTAPAYAAADDPAIGLGADPLKTGAGQEAGGAPIAQELYYAEENLEDYYPERWIVIAYDGKDGAGDPITKGTSQQALYPAGTVTLLNMNPYGEAYFNQDSSSQYSNAYGWLDSDQDEPQTPSDLRSSVEGWLSGGAKAKFTAGEQGAIIARTLEGGGGNYDAQGYDANLMKGKPVAGALARVGTNSGNEWKVTLKSGHEDFAVGSAKSCDRSAIKTIHVSYSGADTGKNEYISALIKDSSGKVTYYGRLKKCASESDASGIVDISIDGKYTSGDTLYLFNEQFNGDMETKTISGLDRTIPPKTDYASELHEVAMPVPATHDYVFKEFHWVGNETDGYTKAQADYQCRYLGKGCTSGYTVVDMTLTETTTEPTCDADGKTTYEATVSAAASPDGVEHKEIRDGAVIGRTGHAFGAWKKLDGARHQRVCAHDSGHVEKANHTWNAGKVTKAATTTATGVKVFTCTVCKSTRTVTIAKLPKKANPLAVKGKTVALKYKAVKKKTKTLAAGKVITFTKKGQGAVTYAKTSGNKKITIDKKTGKVTVKKGLKKGTYKVGARVSAAGNAGYKAATKIVTFTIKVK